MHGGRCAGVEKTAVLSFPFFCHANITMSSLQKGSQRDSRNWEEQNVLTVCIWVTRNWFLIEDSLFSESSMTLCYCSVVKSCPTSQPQGLLQARLPCPSPSPRVCPSSCPLNRWCHPTISSSVFPFSPCLQSFPAAGSFPMSLLFSSGGNCIGTSAFLASVLHIEYSGLISFIFRVSLETVNFEK